MKYSEVIEEFIKKEAEKRNGNADNIEFESDTNLIETGILDSYSIVNLIIFIEETFKVNIFSENVNFDDFQDVDSICKLISSKIYRKM